MSKIDVLGVGFDAVTLEEAVEIGFDMIQNRRGGYVVTPNPEIVMQTLEQPALADAVSGAGLVLPDGIGVVYGAKILGTPLKERVPGIEFAEGLMGKLAAVGGSVYLFGARPGVAERAATNLMLNHPGLRVVGTMDGYFTDDSHIIADINRAKPDLLLVCLGVPKQELWMQQNAGSLQVGLMAGLGGSLDVFAGVVQRAPAVFRKLGLEWFYRLLKQPSRIGRMMKLPLFLVTVMKEKLK